MRIPFLGNTNRAGKPTQSSPPYSGAAPTQPFDQLVGHTTPRPDPGMLRPRAGPPIGQSGRANFYGLPEIDETNPKLAGIAGMRMFDEMYRQDPHIRRLILAAWSPITAGTWALEPYGGEDATDQDRKIAETVWWMLSQWMAPNFTQHIHSLGPLLLRFGFVPFEQIWQPVKYQGKGPTLLGPKKLDPRLPKTIWKWWQDDYGELTYIGQILPNRPDVVIPASNISYYRLGAEGDNWQGVSLLRHCYKPWFIKDRLERIDMIGQERKAVGVPVVYHTTDINPQILDDVERAVANMHTSEVAYLMLPGRKMGTSGTDAVGDGGEWLVDIVKFDSSSGSGIQDSIEYHQTAISASFLTDFLELGHHQVGARATAEVQEDPFLTAINGALLPPVLPVLDELVDRIVKLNWDGADGSPSFKLTLHDDASLSEISSYVQQLAMSTPPAITVDPDLEDWLRERAGLPPANQQARAQREQIDDAQHAAQLAGAQASAQDPQGLAKAAAVAKAAGTVPPDGDSEPPNPDKPATAASVNNAKSQPAKAQTGKKLDDDEPRLLDKGADKRICVDFDGTIADKKTGEPIRDPITGLTAEDVLPLLAKDYEIVIFTANNNHGKIRDWLRKHGLGQFADTITSTKPAAQAYVDDNGVTFTSWASVPEDVIGQVRRGRNPVQPKHLDAPLPMNVKDRVRRSADNLALTGPEGTVTANRVAADDGAIIHDVAWDNGTESHGVRQWDLRRLDDGAPLSGGAVGDNGLQMVPSVAGFECPKCGGAISKRGSTCPACGAKIALDDATAEPSPRWFDRLLSQGQLRQAFDGCRDHIEAAVGPAALLAARHMSQTAAEGGAVADHTPPRDLVDALASHYAGMYQLGHQTVQSELARQRTHLKMLDDPVDTSSGAAAGGSRLARARQRGEHSARNIINRVGEVLGRQQITGLKDATALQQNAENAATAQLHQEALNNTAAMVNDGRYDAAQADKDVVGGVYTSVMDERSCDPCIAADTGDVLPPDEAILMGPPNPDCDGSDRCRCAIVWVLSDDPAALAGV